MPGKLNPLAAAVGADGSGGVFTSTSTRGIVAHTASEVTATWDKFKTMADNGVSEYDIMSRREDESAKQYAERIESYYRMAASSESGVLREILVGYLGLRGDDEPASSPRLAALKVDTIGGSGSDIGGYGSVRNVGGRARTTLSLGDSKALVADAIKRYLASKEALLEKGVSHKIVGISFNGKEAVAEIEFSKRLIPSGGSLRKHLLESGFRHVGNDHSDFIENDVDCFDVTKRDPKTQRPKRRRHGYSSK